MRPPGSSRPPFALALLFLVAAAFVLFEDLFARPFTFLTGTNLAAVKRGETALLLALGTLLAARFVRRDLVHGVLEGRAGKALPHLMGDVAGLAVLLVGAGAIAAGVYGQDLGAVAAAGGLGLAIVGIALRDVILAVFNGAALSAENAFGVGDRVKIGEVEGTVVQSTWRSTTILNRARRHVTIPNVSLGSATITNFDRPDRSDVRTLEICLDYDVTAESAERILLAGVIGASGVALLDAPRVRAIRLDRDGVLYAIRYVIADYAEGAASDHAVIKSILAHLRDAGIGVAYQKREVVQAERRIRVADRSLDRRVLVQQCGLFHTLPAEVCRLIANGLVEHTLEPGARLIDAGETRPSLFIVGEGLVHRRRAKPDGPGFTEERYVATQSFGRRALLSGLPHPATVEAVTQSLVFELTRGVLAAVLDAHPRMRAAFATALALEAGADGARDPGVPGLGHAAVRDRPPAFYAGLLGELDARARRSRLDDDVDHDLARDQAFAGDHAAGGRPAG